MLKSPNTQVPNRVLGFGASAGSLAGADATIQSAHRAPMAYHADLTARARTRDPLLCRVASREFHDPVF